MFIDPYLFKENLESCGKYKDNKYFKEFVRILHEKENKLIEKKEQTLKRKYKIKKGKNVQK